MPSRYLTRPTSAFQRDVRSLTKRNPNLLIAIDEMERTLQEDPFNLTRQHQITKLVNVKVGNGQWRIRSGDYRLRYDIVGDEVIMYSFTHRKETYD